MRESGEVSSRCPASCPSSWGVQLLEDGSAAEWTGVHISSCSNHTWVIGVLHAVSHPNRILTVFVDLICFPSL